MKYIKTIIVCFLFSTFIGVGLSYAIVGDFDGSVEQVKCMNADTEVLPSMCRTSNCKTCMKGNFFDGRECYVCTERSSGFIPVKFDTCENVGAEQYKTEGSCDTITRTCCDQGGIKIWSEWGEECEEYTPTSCPLPKPGTSQTCKLKNGVEGTQTRTVTCNTSTWEWDVGAWSTCKCNKTCSGGQVFEESSCQCCSYGCYWFSGGSNVPYCNCFADYLSFSAWSECCTMSNGDEYRLPSAYSSCSSFASAMGLSLSPTNINRHACARTIN